MSAQLIGISVVGFGYWGPNLTRNFGKTEGARVVSICDMDPAKLSVAARMHPAAETTNDLNEVLGDIRVDAVAIATPVNTHFDLALAALRAGKHVFVEKPLAQSSDQVRKLIDEADRRRLTLMVDHTFIYTPSVKKIRELIQGGELGEIYYYNSSRASLGLFQRDVNVIWDLAVHDISILAHILSDGPVAVSATAVNHIVGAPENIAQLTLFFSGSCVGHINVNWLSPVKVRQTLIGGSRKMVVYDDVEPTEKIKVYDKGITIGTFDESAYQLRIGYRAGDMWAPHLAAKEALQTGAEHFVACVRDGATPITDGVSGLHVVEVLEAASRSIRAQGEPVRLQSAKKPVRSVA